MEKLKSYVHCPAVPQTDEEVYLRIEASYTDIEFKRAMSVLYSCKRAQGLTVLAAWEFVLRAALGKHA